MPNRPNVGDLAPLQKALAANPDDHQARFDLAVALPAGERDQAADELLTIIKRDRAWNEGGAQAVAAILRGLGTDGQIDGRCAAQAVGDLVLERFCDVDAGFRTTSEKGGA